MGLALQNGQQMMMVRRRSRLQPGFFRDERGITTAGMAVALFVSLALIFSGAQLYRVHSAAAEAQEVADACALAADNEVAGFQVVANTCDAVCLSLTLLSVTLYGLGLVAACVPPAESVSVKLIDLAQKTAEKRGQFFDLACQGLNMAQKALPAVASYNALRVAQANDDGAMAGDHLGAAVLVPEDFPELGEAPDDGLAAAGGAVEGEAQAIRDTAREAEEAAKRANEAKEKGFQEDCGADPAYCMRERATSLAGLSESQNPAYVSVDAWSFSVALERARAYYQKRLSGWHLEGRGAEEQADSVIRKRFYQYALDELSSAYVNESEEGFSAYLPHLFRNTDEMRSTPLYTEAVYPITVEGEGQMMHAWSGCPQAAATVGYGSVADLEANRSAFVKCAACRFVPSSVGAVAAASTSIGNGFENHYELMRQACEEYQAARQMADPLAQQVREKVQPLLEALKEVLGNADAFRIHAQPPGRNGVVAMVVDRAQSAASEGFENVFTGAGELLGTRAAVSAATTIEDGQESAGAVVTETLSSFGGGGGIGEAASAAAGAWMSLLRAYEDGQSALEEAVEQGLGSFSQGTASGLGKWAAQALEEVAEAAGLEPADTRCLKPVVLNSEYVAREGDSAVCVRFLQAKEAARAGSSPSTGFAGTLLQSVTHAVGDGLPGNGFEVARIELPFGGSGSLDWEASSGDGLTAAAADAAYGALEDALAGALGDRSWK